MVDQSIRTIDFLSEVIFFVNYFLKTLPIRIWAFAGFILKDFIEMRKVIKSTFEANFGNRMFLFIKEFTCMNNSIFVDKLYESLASDTLEISAKRRNSHISQCSQVL